jgi:hypothetical protein
MIEHAWHAWLFATHSRCPEVFGCNLGRLLLYRQHRATRRVPCTASAGRVARLASVSGGSVEIDQRCTAR